MALSFTNVTGYISSANKVYAENGLRAAGNASFDEKGW